MDNNNNNINNELSRGYVRVMHAVPNAPSVDIYINDELIISNLEYGNYTEYLLLPMGEYKISLFISGNNTSPIITNMLTVNKDSIMTVAASGTINYISLLCVIDANEILGPDKAKIRFLHLSPNAPAVDITLLDGTVIFSNIVFRHITSYINVIPMNYTFQVRVANTSNVVLTVPNVNVVADKYYTVYIIGLVGESPELEALLLTDGEIFDDNM